jgi:hypothetical protein
VGDLHLPRRAGEHPVAVLLHGGYWQTTYGKLVMRPLALDLVSRGLGRVEPGVPPARDPAAGAAAAGRRPSTTSRTASTT